MRHSKTLHLRSTKTHYKWVSFKLWCSYTQPYRGRTKPLISQEMSAVGCRVWEQKISSFYHVQSAHNHTFFTIYISNFYFESCEISFWDSGRKSISLLIYIYTGSCRASAHFFDKPVKFHTDESWWSSTPPDLTVVSLPWDLWNFILCWGPGRIWALLHRLFFAKSFFVLTQQ